MGNFMAYLDYADYHFNFDRNYSPPSGIEQPQDSIITIAANEIAIARLF